MSFLRLVFYHALIGGWSALVGWLLAELIFMHRSSDPSFWAVLLTSAIVGALISGGLSLVPMLTHGSLAGKLGPMGIRLGVGLVMGMVGALIGNLIVEIMPRAVVVLAQAFGWLFLGAAVGSVEGLCGLNPRQIRNGLIGGAVGGFLAGLLYRPLFWLVGGAMSSRAVGFVLLGVCIGLFVGLAQLVFREGWLTVVAGFRPGRQLLLDQREILLGTSERVHLQFAAAGARGVEPVHVRIGRQKDGSYVIWDNNSRTGTFVNGQPVRAAVLRDNDVIQLGMNQVRFRERLRRGQGQPAALPVPSVSGERAPVASNTLARMLEAGPPPTQAARMVQPGPPPARTAAMVQPGPATAQPAPIPVARPAPPTAPASPPKIQPAPRPAPARPAAPAPGAAPAAAPAPTSRPASSPSTKSPVKSACPVCGHTQQGLVGKRVCENCGTKF